MVRRTVVELTDDLTGEPADETIRFAFDGKSYAIDLSNKSAERFRKVIAPYIEAGCREGTVPAPRKRSSEGYTRDYDPAAVRAWAASHGYTISSPGRVSAEIVAAFKAAGN